MNIVEENAVKEHSWAAKGAILFWIVIFALTFIVFSLIQIYFVDTLGIPRGVWVGLIITEISVALLCLLFALHFRKGTLEELGIKRPPIKWLILAVVLAPVVLAVAGIVVTIQTALIGEIPHVDEYVRLLAPTTVSALVVWILIDLVFIGPAEELFARGIVQKGLQNSLQSEKLSILLSGLLFGLWHIDPYRIAGVSAGGIIFAYVYHKSDNNLFVVSLLHGVYDAFAMTIAFIGLQMGG